MRKPVQIAVAALLLAASVLVVGCGGAVAPAAPEATLAPSPTPPPIPTAIPSTSTPVPRPTESAPAAATPEVIQAPEGGAGILYGSLRDGLPGLWTLAEDGFFTAELGLDEAVNPAWPDVSPDGTQIVFATFAATTRLPETGLYVAGLDGSGAERITDSGTHPRWSADGSQIAFSCQNRQDVCVVNADGSNLRNLTETSTASELYPDWLPDGRIVFMSDRDATAEHQSDIYIMNGDGSAIDLLTTGGKDFNGYPSVSPDGTRIAFESDEQVLIGSEIYTMDTGGLNISRLTNDRVWNQAPVWSPDGSSILYAASDDGTNVDLYMVGSGGGQAARLTQHPAEDGGLRLGHTWLPESVEVETAERESVAPGQVSLPSGSDPVLDRIVFATYAEGCSTCLDSGIYTMAANGDELTQLPLDGLFPAWSHDFTRLLYTRDGELYAANADGSDATQVTSALMGLGAAVWNDRGDQALADCQPYDEVDICLVDLDTGVVTNITEPVTGTPFTPAPTWYLSDIATGALLLDTTGEVDDELPYPARLSPGGQEIVAVIDGEASTARVSGADVQQLSSGPAEKIYPIWSANEDYILYTVAPGDGRLYLNVARTDGSRALRPIDTPIAADGPGVLPGLRYYGYSWAP